MRHNSYGSLYRSSFHLHMPVIQSFHPKPVPSDLAIQSTAASLLCKRSFYEPHSRVPYQYTDEDISLDREVIPKHRPPNQCKPPACNQIPFKCFNIITSQQEQAARLGVQEYARAPELCILRLAPLVGRCLRQRSMDRQGLLPSLLSSSGQFPACGQ